jgi:hypothetical protein
VNPMHLWPSCPDVPRRAAPGRPAYQRCEV